MGISKTKKLAVGIEFEEHYENPWKNDHDCYRALASAFNETMHKFREEFEKKLKREKGSD